MVSASARHVTYTDGVKLAREATPPSSQVCVCVCVCVCVGGGGSHALAGGQEVCVGMHLGTDLGGREGGRERERVRARAREKAYVDVVS